eukprot:c24406_g1_i2 orf=422-1456(-)
MEVVPNGVAQPVLALPPQQPLILSDNNADDLDLKAPKKRAETWVQDEIRTLIAYRKDLGGLFNTSKSNKHLWEQISLKMKERGYDRSPTMCTDKWRNLLKEYKKAKHQGHAGSTKMVCYKDLEDILGDRVKHTPYRSPSKYDTSMQQMVPKDFGRSPLNLERRLDHEGHPATSLLSHDTSLSNGMSPWNWRDTSANGGERRAPAGRVITVRYGELTRSIGIDGTAEAIKEAIRCAFGLRSKRAFWLEDEYGVVRSFDRDMPLGMYILNIDEGLTVKVCIYNGSQLTGATEEKTFYSDEDFQGFLVQHGWTSLREVGGYRDIETVDELQTLGMYQRGGVVDSSSL